MKATIAQIWNRPWWLTLLAGIFLGLSFPPLPFPFLSIAGMVLVFRIVDLSDTARQAAIYTWVGFLIWNAIVTYWLMMASVAAGAAAIVANAAVMTLPVMMQKKTAEWFKHPVAVALLQASWWVGVEYLHHHWDLAWPWLSLGNAWANVPSLVQYISATGYLGISFWVVASAALACRWFAGQVDGGSGAGATRSGATRAGNGGSSGAGTHSSAGARAARSAGTLKWATLSVLLAFPAVSLLQYALQPDPPTEHTLDTIVVQPDFDSYEQYGGHDTALDANGAIHDQADSLVESSTDLILWPESSIHPGLSNDAAEVSMAHNVYTYLQGYVDHQQATLVGGTTWYQYYPENEAPPLARRGGRGPFHFFNAAVSFSPNGEVAVYRKHNLVPIVERFPFVRALSTVDVFGLVDWVSLQGYGKGWESDQFTVEGVQLPALICYDSVFPGWVRKFVANGAGLLTVITNDGWWGNTGGHQQHFAYARLRAIEFRRFVVRSANNGISGVIAPDGSVEVRTPYGVHTSFQYHVPVIQRMSVYAQYGDWLPQLSLLAGALSLLAVFRRRRR